MRLFCVRHTPRQKMNHEGRFKILGQAARSAALEGPGHTASRTATAAASPATATGKNSSSTKEKKMKMKRREKRGPTQHTAQPIETLPTPSPPVPYAHTPPPPAPPKPRRTGMFGRHG